MATTTAQITLTSADLLTDSLSLSSTATLTNADGAVGMTQTTGLARKTTSTLVPYTLLNADDYTANKAHKLYLKNTATNATYYYDIGIGIIGNNTTIGRIYAGDWALIPWSATGGTKEVFTITFSGTWAAADTITFDGVTINADTAHATTAAAIRATYYPNWVVTGSGSDAIFTARKSRADQEIDTSEWTVVDASGSDAAIAVATTTEGSISGLSDIIITPGGSSTNAVTLEYMLLHE